MALTDAAVDQPAVAHIFVGAVGATAPTAANINAFNPSSGALTTPSGYTNFGHTSLDNDFSPTYDGGDTTTRGSRQNSLLRQTVATITEGLQVNAIQIDKDQLAYYYGTSTGTTEGKFEAPDTRSPLEKAVIIIYVDGSRKVAEYHPRAAITSQGAIVNAADGWLEFPVKMTWLKQSGQPITVWLADTVTYL